MVVAGEAVARFAGDLEALLAPGERIGLAVSGGPDSLALLVLAAAARPGLVVAASVDHGLRSASRGEAEAAASACRTLGVAHDILTIRWDAPPASAVQERARSERYRALGQWAEARGLGAIATGHHADDQAETVIMRLNRGAGVRGLGAMRPRAPVPAVPAIALLRPLLGWRRAELAAVVAASGLAACDDPSNRDLSHERVRFRSAMADAAWLDPAALAVSAAHLAAADEAIEFAVDAEWARRVAEDGSLCCRPGAAPREIRRRLAARAIAALGHEGDTEKLRGGELDRLVDALDGGRSATLRGVRASGGAQWRFVRAPARR